MKNKKAISTIVDYYVAKITDVEMVIRKNLKAQKMPWLIATSTGNENKVNQFYNSLNNDEDVLFFEFDDGEKEPKALVSGAPYILDKLYDYKQALENELLTFLGFNNLGASEKKEHLLVSEIDSNNEVIAQAEENFVSMLEGFIKRVNETLGKTLKLKKKTGVNPSLDDTNPEVKEKKEVKEEQEQQEEE